MRQNVYLYLERKELSARELRSLELTGREIDDGFLLNLYFRLRFGVVNSINTYSMLNVRFM